MSGKGVLVVVEKAIDPLAAPGPGGEFVCPVGQLPIGIAALIGGGGRAVQPYIDHIGGDDLR